MNKREADLLKVLNQSIDYSQREISDMLHCSVGSVNKTLKILRENEYLYANGSYQYGSTQRTD